ncbi:alpha/beta hydrolase [Paludibacterium yongneupense]|uniref:alpha/beta hydrolase n=1 Tax=Paludibacterium yongneupense TaxID=400061 RepID=UPI00040BEA1A|nr:alpha/beta fold hydrolase [Paludibacterium yongneupense]
MSPPDNSHAVIMLHGLCGTPLEMGPIPKVLVRQGYTVSQIEIPGFSASQLEAGVSPNWENWCDCVEEEITRLKRGHETVSICGLSMGATLALATAIRRDDILAIVALSPVLRYDGWSVPWYVPLLDIPYALGFRSWSYKESEPYGLRNIEMRRRVARSLEKDGVAEVGAAAIPARQLAAAKHMMAHVRTHLRDVQSRLAVIHAVDDETAAPRNAEIIMRGVSSEVRKVIWLGDSYHIITFDNEREVVLNEAVRFFNRSTSSFENDMLFRQNVKRAPLRDRVGTTDME